MISDRGPIKPNIYNISPREDGTGGGVIGDIIPISIEGVGKVPSIVIGSFKVCTDYFERICDSCNLTKCPFNTSAGKERR